MAQVPSAPQVLSITREPLAAHAPLAGRAPAPSHVLAASIATADLRDKLNCHCDGEDSHITILHQHERRCNIEGRNLEWEFDSLTSV
jgi:hypothetical protein